MVGRTIGKYRIVGQLGRGGMGTVYKAVDETLDREVAIKVLNPELADTDIMKRFRAEATTLAKLNHPEIATIYELFRSETDLLMVMEFVRGETLDKLSERLGPMPPDRAAYLVDKVLSALEHAHRAGIVHRDMKPANVMVTDIGGVKIMDFGIARVRGAEHMTVDGYMMGTPAYMPPEQVLGQEVDGRADLYSVGVVFYRLLTGALPFKADTAIGMVQKQISDAPTPLNMHRAGLPDWCESVLQRALAKSPADRFQTAEEFRSAIGHVTGMTTSLEHTKAFAASDIETTSPPVAFEKLGLTPTGATPNALHRSPQLAVAVGTPSPDVAAARAAEAVSPAASPTMPTPVHTKPASLDGQTIVLRKQHFAVAGSLLAIVALGVAALAYVALRRPVVVPSGSNAASSAPPAAPAAAASSTSPAAPGSTTPESATGTATPGTEPPAASGSATPPTPGAATAGTPGATTATPAPTTTAPGPAPTTTPVAANAARGGSTTPAPGSQVPAAVPASSGGAKPAASSTSTAAAPGSTTPAAGATDAGRGTTAKPSAAPPRAPITFDVKALLGSGNRARERDAQLILAEGKVTVTAEDNHDALHSVGYDSVVSINYSTGRDPLWKSPEGPSPVARAGGGFLGIRGDRQWVALRTKDTKDPFVVLRFLNPGAARSGIKALEERTRLTAETVSERKDAK